MKRAVIGLVVGAAIVIATLCVMEGAASALLFVRDYRGATAPQGVIRPHTTHDTLLGWVNRPSFSSPDEYGKGIGLTTTPLGLRANGASDSSSAGTGEGLVCSGDAYTLGYGVSDDHTWCALLEKARPGLRTYNMGQAGYGLDQSALWYERDGGRVPHQLQIVGLTNAQLERMPTPSYVGRFKPEMVMEGGKIVVHGVPVPQQTSDALRDARRARMKYDLRTVQAFSWLTRVDGRASEARRIDERWPIVERVLDELAAANVSHGSRLVLAYLPAKRELAPGSPDARRMKLASYARRRGIAFIDLTPLMRAVRPDSIDLSYISRVPRGAAPGVADHLSNLGNAWVARTLAERLFPKVP